MLTRRRPTPIGRYRGELVSLSRGMRLSFITRTEQRSIAGVDRDARELAHRILLHFAGRWTADRYAWQFAHEHEALLSGSTWELPTAVVGAWLARQGMAEARI